MLLLGVTFKKDIADQREASATLWCASSAGGAEVAYHGSLCGWLRLADLDMCHAVADRPSCSWSTAPMTSSTLRRWPAGA